MRLGCLATAKGTPNPLPQPFSPYSEPNAMEEEDRSEIRQGCRGVVAETEFPLAEEGSG